MATFYIQLENKLLQISGELTAENISKALGYVPVDSSTLNNYATKDEVSDLVDMSMVEELSQRVDNITFDSLKDNPFLQDGSGELNIVDEAGNIIAKIDVDGIHSVDFIAGEHRLSDKTDKTYVDEAVKNVKVDLTGYATEEYVNNIDFYNIKDNPIVNNGDGKLLFVDENGYIGLQLEEDGLYVKDVIGDGHKLSDKADKSELSDYVTTDELEGYAKIEAIPSLEGYVKETDLPNFDEYATEQWVNNKNYATEDDLNNIDYSSINNVPVSEDETGELNIIDESGNVGMKISSEAVYAKDFISGEHKLTEKLDSNNLKTINNESLVGDGNIVVGNIVSEEDDSLTIDDVNTNTYVKYVAQTLTEEQKAQVRTNIGISENGNGVNSEIELKTINGETLKGSGDINTKSKITISSLRSGIISLNANEVVHMVSALTGSTTIKVTHKDVDHDDEWSIKFFITSTTPPTISFTCSNSTYPISWLNNNMPIFENGYMYEMTFKQFNNQYLAVCGKFPI